MYSTRSPVLRCQRRIQYAQKPQLPSKIITDFIGGSATKRAWDIIVRGLALSGAREQDCGTLDLAGAQVL